MSEKNAPQNPIWNCQLNGPAPVTVGEKLTLECSGPQVLGFDSSRFQVLVPDAQNGQYMLKILEIKSADDRHIQAVVTTYIPAKYEADGTFILTDGKQNVQLNNVKLQTQSVIQQNQQPPPQPFGPFPPWVLSLPFWFYFAIATAIILPIATVIYLIYQRRERKKLFDTLKKMRTARLPFDEFHREIRIIEKKYGIEPEDMKGYVSELEKTFRLYLIRELIVPALQKSDGTVFREIKKSHKEIWKHCGSDLKRMLLEFKAAQKGNVSLTDCRQLYSMSIQVSEKIFNVLSKSTKRTAL